MTISKTIALSLSFLFFIACTTSPKDRPRDPAFAKLTAHFLGDLWKTYPNFALHMGIETYAHTLKIPNKKSREEDRQFLEKYRTQFLNTNNDKLSIGQITDKELILNSIDRSLWELDSFKSYEWNPSRYNIGNALDTLLASEKMSEGEKLRAISQQLGLAPPVLPSCQK